MNLNDLNPFADARWSVAAFEQFDAYYSTAATTGSGGMLNTRPTGQRLHDGWEWVQDPYHQIQVRPLRPFQPVPDHLDREEIERMMREIDERINEEMAPRPEPKPDEQTPQQWFIAELQKPASRQFLSIRETLEKGKATLVQVGSGWQYDFGAVSAGRVVVGVNDLRELGYVLNSPDYTVGFSSGSVKVWYSKNRGNDGL